MGNPLRNRNPEAYRLITIRTTEARLLLSPSKDINKTIGGILARYQEIFEIEIYAYCVMGNHYHLLIRAPLSNTDEFLENVNREIARRVNWKRKRRGALWGRRYSEQHVLSYEDLLEAYLYTVTNPVKHGMVKHPSEWPGISSYEQSLTEKGKRYSFRLYSELIPKRVTHTLKLTPLPQHAELPKKKRVALINELIEERVKYLQNQRYENGEGFMGVEKLSLQSPYRKPREVSYSKRPSCYTKTYALYREFKTKLKAFRQAYFEASEKYRLNEDDYEFPTHSYLPPKIRIPRIAPFTPIQQVA